MDVHPPSISCVSSSWSIATWENRKKRVLVKLIVTKTSCLSTKHTGHSPNCVADWQMCAETKCLNLCFPSPSILTHSHFLFMLSEWQPVGRCWDINSHSWTSHDQRPWPASFGWTPAPEHVKTPFTLDLAGPGEHLTFWLCTVRTWMDGCMAWHGMVQNYLYIHTQHTLFDIEVIPPLSPRSTFSTSVLGGAAPRLRVCTSLAPIFRRSKAGLGPWCLV